MRFAVVVDVIAVASCLLTTAARAAPKDAVVVVLPVDAAIGDELRTAIDAVPGFAAQPKKATAAALSSSRAHGVSCDATTPTPNCALHVGGLAGGAVVVLVAQNGDALSLRAFDVARALERDHVDVALAG